MHPYVIVEYSYLFPGPAFLVLRSRVTTAPFIFAPCSPPSRRRVKKSFGRPQVRADLLSPACFCCFSSRRRDSCHESWVKVAAGFRLPLSLVHVFWRSRTNRVVFFSLVDEPHKKEQKITHEACNTVPGAHILVGFSKKEPWGSSALATALKKQCTVLVSGRKALANRPRLARPKSIDAQPTRVVQRMGVGCSTFIPEFRVGGRHKQSPPGPPGDRFDQPPSELS